MKALGEAVRSTEHIIRRTVEGPFAVVYSAKGRALFVEHKSETKHAIAYFPTFLEAVGYAHILAGALKKETGLSHVVLVGASAFVEPDRTGIPVRV